ncbi:helix-turn-helix domain-containing protein [Paenibacillus oenotherae]|uniref:Helix-turn-helix domain-containing protein n=1 Tax=Paenibacillus oenotherae TaxID=1435645 RepID=A0ABS7D396_9BACL|nr:XRE family transcriptional regulator [Paenibacillus oenotherae]MBW7474313.1 helix-turn-helix domain-containing protein [Paenibacillus oenotherae]
MSLGARISEKRKEKGLSQEALGTFTGVSAAFISQIEKAKRNPSYGLLQKISNELDVSLEYLVSGDMQANEDPNTKMITSISRYLDRNQKKQLIDYIHFLTGTKRYFDLPFFDTSIEYAHYLLRHYRIEEPPIEPFQLAAQMGVEIVQSHNELDYEGVLHKGGEKPVIILSQGYKPRQKFTVAMMLGHLCIPWHVKSTFYREKNKRSLDEEDIFAIEAREFAGELLVPTGLLKQEFKSIGPGIDGFEWLAEKRFGSSMEVIGQKYQQSHNKTTAFLTSKGINVNKKYEAGFPSPLVDQLQKGSLAFELTNNPPSSKQIKKGFVPTNAWVKNPSKPLNIYEESLFDPAFGFIVTFLQLK